MGKLMGVEQLFEGRHFDREVIILRALVSSLQAEPARPGGDDGRTRPVVGSHHNHALATSLCSKVRAPLEPVSRCHLNGSASLSVQWNHCFRCERADKERESGKFSVRHRGASRVRRTKLNCAWFQELP